jgi:hypothetical protein
MTIFCTWLGIWCAGAVSEQRALCARPDITAYELALLLQNQHTLPDQLYKAHPELLRHTVATGAKCEPK